MKKRTRSILALAGVSFLSACASSPSFENIYYYQLMDTTFTFHEAGASEEIQQQIQAILTNYHNEANTVAVSGLNNVYTLNQTNDPVTVDSTLYDLLQFSETMANKTQGYFNPLVGSLTSLWKEHLFPSKDANGVVPDSTLPNDEEIALALQEAKESSLVFYPLTSQVQRKGRGTIDLGGIAKGYACEKVKEYLDGLSYKNYFFNGGNSSIIFGEKGNADTPWTLTFADIDGYLKVMDAVVGSSSVMEQLAEVPKGSGVYYSHIVNPFTGSASVDWYGMSALGDDAGILDALTTVFVLLGPDDPLTSSLESDYNLKTLFYKLNVSISYQDDGTRNIAKTTKTLVTHGLEPVV
jgi:thiamine biosynthesis lipoprotein